MIDIRITSQSVPALSEDNGHREEGSEIIFHGRVRDSEGGQKISALEYEYYAGMAENVMNALAKEVVEKYNLHSLKCIHRVGVVPVGEISVRIIIWSGHRREGLAAMDWFISRLKEDVPIWKWGIPESGPKFPSKSE